MRHVLFGEWLGRLVPLSPHDISEILADQAASGRSFGEIALAWGLCRPQHVWQAWWRQLSERPRQVDLDRVGVDSQAIVHLPRPLALQFRAVPIRAFDTQLVVAASILTLTQAQEKLPPLVRRQLVFVPAADAQIDKALRTYYTETRPAARAVSLN
jgi:hypothetical protein